MKRAQIVASCRAACRAIDVLLPYLSGPHVEAAGLVAQGKLQMWTHTVDALCRKLRAMGPRPFDGRRDGGLARIALVVAEDGRELALLLRPLEHPANDARAS